MLENVLGTLARKLKLEKQQLSPPSSPFPLVDTKEAKDDAGKGRKREHQAETREEERHPREATCDNGCWECEADCATAQEDSGLSVRL